jgi:hypothetical protein
MLYDLYPTLLQMAPRDKKYPVTRYDGWKFFFGPKVGSLAPDGSIIVRSNEPQQSRKTLILGEKKFCILIFDGIYHGDTTQQGIDIRTEIQSLYDGIVSSYVVTIYYTAGVYDPVSYILGDVANRLHESFAASGQCIYCIDQEGVIQRRSL